jgi:hypothetical protein
VSWARRMPFIRSPGWRPRGPQHPWPRANPLFHRVPRADLPPF